jgi:MFS family permease
MAPTTQTGSAPAAVTGGRRTLVLLVCCMSLFLTGLDATAVTIGLPAIGRDLHASVAGLQWTSDSYTIVLASLLLVSGSIADRIGRRTTFTLGLVIFTLGSWLCSLAPGLGWLIGCWCWRRARWRC